MLEMKSTETILNLTLIQMDQININFSIDISIAIENNIESSEKNFIRTSPIVIFILIGFRTNHTL